METLVFSFHFTRDSSFGYGYLWCLKKSDYKIKKFYELTDAIYPQSNRKRLKDKIAGITGTTMKFHLNSTYTLLLYFAY